MIDSCFFLFSLHLHDSTNRYSEVDIKKVLEFLIDFISVVFANQVFQKNVGISTSMYCDPLLAGWYLYHYDAKVIQKLLREKSIPVAVAFNSTFRYISTKLYL
jgi:hypothetical protein